MRRLIALAVALGVWCAPAAHGTEAEEVPRHGTTEEVVHRVVWDASQRDGPAVELRSANVDGSDQRAIYRRKKGWITELVLNRVGSEVALTPFPGRNRRAGLVIVDVLTGEHLDVLRAVPRFAFVTSVGWSPEGRRLVFIGRRAHAGVEDLFVWTIRRDGTGLKRSVRVAPELDQQFPIQPALAWTSDGIYYCYEGDLRLLHRGVSQVLLPRVTRLRISGDGQWLFLQRDNGRGVSSLWRIRPDGSGLEQLIRRTDPHPRAGYLTGPVPDHAGELLLTVADGDLPGEIRNVVHPATRAPRPTDPVLDFVNAYVVTWN